MSAIKTTAAKLWLIKAWFPSFGGVSDCTKLYYYAAPTFNDAIAIHNTIYTYGEIRCIEQVGYVTTRVAREEPSGV